MLVDGTAEVCRVEDDGDGTAVQLAQLSEGACFGEEALISHRRRNATVQMLTAGVVLQLRKGDFNELVRAPKLRWPSAVEASQRLRKGACLLDVRESKEFEQGHLDGALSLPLNGLREGAQALDSGKAYICCCDNGRLSATAAFLLVQAGFSAGVLRGGLDRLPGFSD